LELLTERLKQYELSVLKEFDLLLPISKTEEKYFQQNRINSSYYLPFGIGGIQIQHAEIESNTIYHIGSMDWAPNLEGVEWFLKEVWKDLQKELPMVKLYLAGKKMPKHISSQSNQQTIVLGEVDDVNEFSATKEIMIVPLQSGAGIRVKIIEAMALGKPIIATSVAVEGIGATDGKHIAMVNTPEEFKEKITYYLTHPEECRTMGNNAKEFVHTYYQKEKIYTELVEGITHLL
jgi:polysaccharide biosynthesis protein PslH